MEKTIAIIENDNSLRGNLMQHLRQQGFAVAAADGIADVLSLLSATGCRIVLLGLEGMKREGVTMLRVIRQRFPQVFVITINSSDQLDLSMESMRLGAFDELMIPLDLDTLMASIRKAQAAIESRTI